MDEHALAGLKMRAIEQALPRSQCADRHRGSFCMGEFCGFWRDAARLRDAEFGESAIRVPIVHAVNFLAGLKIAHVGADFGDDTAEFVDRNRVQARRSVFLLDCRLPAELGWRYACGVDAN